MVHKARNDLETARLLFSLPDSPTDTAIYHCQQAAEKCIKGWLLWRGQVFPRTHHLGVLLEIAIQLEPNFDPLLDAAELLTPTPLFTAIPTNKALRSLRWRNSGRRLSRPRTSLTICCCPSRVVSARLIIKRNELRNFRALTSTLRKFQTAHISRRFKNCGSKFTRQRPAAESCFSYGLPAFRLGGVTFAAFAACAKHCSYYPMSGSIAKAFKDDLKGFRNDQRFDSFTPEKPLPATVVRSW